MTYTAVSRAKRSAVTHHDIATPYEAIIAGINKQPNGSENAL